MVVEGDDCGGDVGNDGTTGSVVDGDDCGGDVGNDGTTGSGTTGSLALAVVVK